jgi:hypothetical protein
MLFDDVVSNEEPYAEINRKVVKPSVPGSNPETDFLEMQWVYLKHTNCV